MRHIKKFILFSCFFVITKIAFSQACITLSSAAGTDVQTVCINTPIITITYALPSGITATVSGLPAGVTGEWRPRLFTIEGTPTVQGIFSYTVTTSGICLGTPTASGTITVNPLPIVTFTGTLTPQCITSTTYLLTGGLPAGGVYSGAGVTGTNFNASVAGPGTHIITYTYKDINGCESLATNSINVNALPVVAFSGVLTPQCVNSTVYALTGGSPAGGIYSGPGVTGTNFNASVAGTGTHTITYTYTDINGCTNSATNSITVNPIPLPTLTSSDPDNLFCAGTVVTFTAGGGVTYNFRVNGSIVQSGASSTYTTNSLTNGQVVDVIVTGSNGCSATSTGITNIVMQAPVALASNNGPVCPGALLNLTGGPNGMLAYSWSGPNGFSSAMQSPVISTSATPAMAGVYSLVVTGPGGCQNTATTTVVVRALPAVTAANNGPVCVGSPLSLTGGPMGMSSYLWSGPNGFTSNLRNPLVSGAATLLMEGAYSLTVTNSFGCQNTAITNVVVSPLPLVTAANNGPVCSGTPLNLTGGPAEMTSYSWTGPGGFVSTLQNPIVSLLATTAMSGTYTLTVVNSSGCQSSISTNAIVNQSPVATAANNGPVCEGFALNLTGGPAGMTAYSWSGPGSFSSAVRSPVVSPAATIAMSGIYLLTVTGPGGCQDTASTRAFVNAVPVSNAGTGGIECDLNFVLNAVPSIGTGLWSVVTGPGTAVFSPQATNPAATVTVSAPGNYTFRWTETNGPCISSSVVTVNFYLPPDANAGTGGDECDLNFILNAVPSTGIGTWTMTAGSGTVIFSPNANTPSATVVVSEYGSKTFMWKEENGNCADSSTIIVNFYQEPSANAGTGGNNCGLQYNLRATPSVGTGTWSRVSGPGSVTFVPNANSPAASALVSAYGTHVFRWTEVNGTCSDSAEISVLFIQQPSANGGNGGHECDLNFNLNAVQGTGTGTWSKVTGPGNVTFSPDAHQPDAIVTVTQFGAYDLAWTEVNSLCSSSDIVRVTFHDLPVVSAGSDDAICIGSNTQLNASGAGLSFLWSPANILNNPAIPNPVATPAVSTIFTVTLTDQWGCKNSDQVNVEVRTHPVADAGPDQELSFTFETNMEAATPGNNQTGEWTILSGSGDFSDLKDHSALVTELGLDTNIFVWTVTNEVCPVSSDTVEIIVWDLRIPTLITPNLDGKNDFFIINGIETLGMTTLTIFNRWGARVYEKKDYNNSWDGVDENEDPLPDDTYFFILKTEQTKTIKGYIVIRR